MSWFRRNADTDYTVYRSSNGRPARRLGLVERVLLERERVNHWGTVTSVLLVESNEQLNLDQLQKALVLLNKWSPLLRMRVKENADTNEAWFEEMENPDMVDFQVVEEKATDNWMQSFEHQLNGPPFQTELGPLWRVKCLKEAFDEREERFRNALVFTFHHVICDAMSIFEVQKKLLEFLNLLHIDGEHEVESLPLKPPLEFFMRHLIEPSFCERFLFSSFFKLQKIKAVFLDPKPHNSYLSVYPPVAYSTPSVVRKTSVLTRSLSAQETTSLVKCSKANKCTVHGAITAATHLATARLLLQKQSDLKTPVTLQSSYTFSARKDCQPAQVNSDDVGVFVSASALSIPVPSCSIRDPDGQNFWEFARACTQQVHSQLSTGAHRKLLKFYHCVDISAYCMSSNYKHNEGRRSQILNITNCGSLRTNQSEEHPYKFAGSFFSLQGDQIGHTFGNNVMTVDGKLYWCVEYFPHVTTKAQAEAFIELTVQILRDACV